MASTNAVDLEFKDERRREPSQQNSIKGLLHGDSWPSRRLRILKVLLENYLPVKETVAWLTILQKRKNVGPFTR